MIFRPRGGVGIEPIDKLLKQRASRSSVGRFFNLDPAKAFSQANREIAVFTAFGKPVGYQVGLNLIVT